MSGRRRDVLAGRTKTRSATGVSRSAATVRRGLPKGVDVHPHGLCESMTVGPDTKIAAFAHVMDGAVVGAACEIGNHAFVESGAIIGNRVIVKNATLIWDRVRIENDVYIGPNVTFTNDLRPRSHVARRREDLAPTRVRRGATVGAGATVLCGVTIGEFAFVAAGAVVTADLPAHALAVGNPARQIGWVCECGERLASDLECSACGARYAHAVHGLSPRAA